MEFLLEDFVLDELLRELFLRYTFVTEPEFKVSSVATPLLVANKSLEELSRMAVVFMGRFGREYCICGYHV